MKHTVNACALFSFTNEVRFFAGRFYRAYFYFCGEKGQNRLNRPAVC